AAVVKQPPVRTPLADLGPLQPLELTVIPLPQVGFDLAAVAEPGQIAGALRPLERAGEDDGEGEGLQPLAEPAGVGLAAGGERDVVNVLDPSPEGSQVDHVPVVAAARLPEPVAHPLALANPHAGQPIR